MKQLQHDLEAEIQKNNLQTQDQIKQLQAGFQQQLQQMQQEILKNKK